MQTAVDTAGETPTRQLLMKIFEGRVDLEGIERIQTPLPFPPSHINSYVIPGRETVLIDTGIKTEAAWKALNEGLAAIGLKITDIRHLLVTHGHIDHFGQAKRIQDASGCHIYAHELERYHMEANFQERSTPDSPIFEFFQEWGVEKELVERAFSGQRAEGVVRDNVKIDHAWTDGEVLQFPQVRLKCIWVPGHAVGHTVLLEEQRGILFSADHLLPDISPVPLLNFPDASKKEKTRSLVDYVQSLYKVRNLAVTVALPSHGEPIPDIRALIDSYALHRNRRYLKIRNILEEKGPMTAYQVSEHVFNPDRAKMLMHLTMSETVGFLELLEADGILKIEKRDGLLYYSIRPDAG